MKFNSMIKSSAIVGLSLVSMGLYADEVHDRAFQKLSSSISPMTTYQIIRIRQIWNESQRAKTFTGSTPPKPSNLTRTVNLSVGGLPTVIRLGAGYVSVIAFFDANGKPWPIRGYNIGNPSMVNIIWNQSTADEDASGSGLSSTLMMQAQTMYRSTNMVVLLRGLNTPVLLELIPGQQVVDYRLDLRVPRKGPYSDDSEQLPQSVAPMMMDLLNNLPPDKSVQVTVKGGEAQAWRHGDRLYLRTPYTVISPAWISKVSAANGDMHVYEMSSDNVILALKNGETIQLTVE